jgi:ArsR family transcriptional regulator, arsenate/arsenite/antimonite-responsive transcriptional repressor
MAKQLLTIEGLFKALADATRLRILGLLLTGEVCVCDIHESLKIPQPKASRHLAYLRQAGLVDTRRDGLWIHYRLAKLADPVLTAIIDAVRQLGRELTEAAIRLAQDRQVPAIYLLTTTAADYFPRFGFERATRADVPAGVQQSVEFTSACPSTAIVMRKLLRN